MTYNTLDNNVAEGLIYFIDDLNTRFDRLLFSTQTDGEDDFNRRFSGLSRLDVQTGIPHTKDSDGEYSDSLFDDNFDIVTFFMESGDRKMLKAAATESKIDLYVAVDMTKFTAFEEEGIINEVHEVMKLTAFEPESLSRDEEAIKALNYTDKVPDSMAPYFIFKISSKLIGNLKVN
jgi:hypothetical protein